MKTWLYTNKLADILQISSVILTLKQPHLIQLFHPQLKQPTQQDQTGSVNELLSGVYATLW
jgi:hypothetical protein